MNSKLFSSLVIKDLILKNRVAVSPMCQYSSVDGFANDWHLVHYGSRAVGGAGLIIQEATAVLPEGRITPGDLGLWDDLHVDFFKKITAFIGKHGSVPGIQLAHAGRKAGCSRPWEGGKQLKIEEGGWTPVAPSALTFSADDAPPHVPDMIEIRKVITAFKDAAERALLAGYKVVEIHSAHGYMIHEFLSPVSNHRTDEYGGCFENRVRFLLEIVNAVRVVWSENLPLFVRISATDWVEGGWNPDEAVKLAILLKKAGVDLIDCSSGGLVPYQKIPLASGYQVGFSERIRKESGILTGAVGLITDALQAENILEQGQADLILFGREVLREPYFALKASKIVGDEIAWPVQYLRARR